MGGSSSPSRLAITAATSEPLRGSHCSEGCLEDEAALARERLVGTSKTRTFSLQSM